MANELWIYDVIGSAMYGGDVSPLQVRDEMAKFDKGQPILVRINSPGGVCNDAVAIRAMLMGWGKGYDVRVDGVAASAASFIAAGGRHVSMARGARMMIHDPYGGLIGGAKEFRKYADQLDALRITLAEAYATKSGKPISQVLDYMVEETWFSDAEAVDYGLADEKIDWFRCRKRITLRRSPR
jgi:ATP-dependent Clp protease protease subunit